MNRWTHKKNQLCVNHTKAPHRSIQNIVVFPGKNDKNHVSCSFPLFGPKGLFSILLAIRQ